MTVGMNYDAAANVRRLLRAVWPDPVPVDPDEGLKAARLLARGARLTGLGGFPPLDAWPEALRADKAGEAFHDAYHDHDVPGPLNTAGFTLPARLAQHALAGGELCEAEPVRAALEVLRLSTRPNVHVGQAIAALSDALHIE